MKQIATFLFIAFILSASVCWGEVTIDHNDFPVSADFECPDGQDMKITVTGDRSVTIKCVGQPGWDGFYKTDDDGASSLLDTDITASGECVELETDENGRLTGSAKSVPCDKGQ